MKKAISVFLVFILVTCFCIPAMAATRAATVAPELTFDGTTANCWTSVVAINQDIVANLELWYNGNMIKSWPGSGESYITISGSRPVFSGRTYSLRVTGTIDGVSFESNFITKTCP